MLIKMRPILNIITLQNNLSLLTYYQIYIKKILYVKFKFFIIYRINLIRNFFIVIYNWLMQFNWYTTSI